MAFDIMQLLRGVPNMMTGQGTQNMLTNPTAPRQGEIRNIGGQQMQYAETTGMQGATGPQGWIPVNSGFMDKLQGFSRSPIGQNLQNAMLGWAQGGSMQDSLGKGAQMVAMGRRERQGDQDRNQTLEFLRSKGMDEQSAQAAVSNPAVLTDVLKGMIQGQDPMKALELEKAQLEVANLRNPTTDDIKEYQAAKAQGFGGTLQDWIVEGKKAGATNVTVGGGRYGTIPQGYELRETPEGAQLVPIPGGPEDTTKKDLAAQGQADVATRVVTSAAQRARDAAKERNFGHVGQGLAAMVPWTDSAEVARQVDVLKSTAKVENLTAMRQASPTGGALGSVTEKEADMLASKSGALDPSSPTFQRDLDDYELTLLQVVHGPEEGARLYKESRGGGGAQPPAHNGNVVDYSDYFGGQ